MYLTLINNTNKFLSTSFKVKKERIVLKENLWAGLKIVERNKNHEHKKKGFLASREISSEFWVTNGQTNITIDGHLTTRVRSNYMWHSTTLCTVVINKALHSNRIVFVLSLIVIKIVNPNTKNKPINHFVNPYC